MNTPTPQEVRSWTPRTNWSELGYPLTGSGADALAMEVGLAVDYVEWVTGRQLDATMPVQLERMAQKAVALRAQQQVNSDDEEQQETLFAATNLASFNATGYTESYRDIGQSEKNQREGMMINPWPELNRLLWALCTPVRLAWWRGFLSNGGIPAYGIVEMDWSGANRFGGFPNAVSGGLPGDYPTYMLGGDMGGWASFGEWPALGSNTSTVVPW